MVPAYRRKAMVDTGCIDGIGMMARSGSIHGGSVTLNKSLTIGLALLLQTSGCTLL